MGSERVIFHHNIFKPLSDVIIDGEPPSLFLILSKVLVLQLQVEVALFFRTRLWAEQGKLHSRFSEISQRYDFKCLPESYYFRILYFE